MEDQNPGRTVVVVVCVGGDHDVPELLVVVVVEDCTGATYPVDTGAT